MITLRSNPYQYQRRLPHMQKAGSPLFVTFCKLSDDPLPPQAQSIVLEHCLHDHGKTMALQIVVVMPEHVHLLLTPLCDGQGWPVPLPKILKRIKGVSARRVNQLLGAEGPVWQEESFDHLIRSDESLEDKIDYIRQTPVRRGLSLKPEYYPWLWPNL